ncbi:hypothetical protein D9619_012323 [Psilocybe cf. subviscida]|uniref:Uncharacterized protein n=1 Tax=Psilocybe cf. subviscida TaxID=2480587 RepID=A0A8H5ARI7_9AGAR|nr:hypothetical protein D9619_012323 [Psilocybe cf. subviscida]
MFFTVHTTMSTAVPRPSELPFDTNYRSTTDIIWSCVATIFACTWISVHPNVSGFNTSWTRRIKDRIFLMFWGIAAPEFLVIFAYRQWIGSRDISEAVLQAAPLQTPSLGAFWTPTHSHFLQMGGFMFCDPSSHIPAEYIEVHELIGVNASEIGRDALLMVIKNSPSDDEIWDRSKADTFSKLIVALQTSWFLAQIVSRRIQNLAITEIEIITLAYAAFNGAMYAFWWTKPLDVQSPIVIPFTNIHALRQHYALRQQYAHLQRPYAPRQPGGMPTEVETRSTMLSKYPKAYRSLDWRRCLSPQPCFYAAKEQFEHSTQYQIPGQNRIAEDNALSSQALGHYAPRLCPHRIPTA